MKGGVCVFSSDVFLILSLSCVYGQVCVGAVCEMTVFERINLCVGLTEISVRRYVPKGN